MVPVVSSLQLANRYPLSSRRQPNDQWWNLLGALVGLIAVSGGGRGGGETRRD